MKFIADAMLGRLAKWLRLLGFDTLYYPHIEDSLILRIAREQDRIILTRDTRLVKVKGINTYLLLEDNDSFNQLRSVITTYDMLPQLTEKGKITLPAEGRCSVCNEPLTDVAREKARPHVPEYTYNTCSSFKHCAICGKFYWKGSHQENLRKKLSELLFLT
jgi:uncharacterized protein with PIN domain